MSMEKITLKPIVKELLHRNGEDGVHFDVLSYQAAGNQEKVLGSLLVIGQIKYSEEDLSYAISLLSSLAKREYYSEQSLQGQNAKMAFEHTLGKLNEVLDDFFKNKNLKLNIGLAAISGDNIYISRLGKFRIALARDAKYIDVLSNVELFTKDTEDAKQFSNIISGKLHSQDKIFAYFPTRSISAREKQINETFVKEDQETFGQKIALLATNATNFSCCGVHINMQEIKEIPVETRPSYGRPALVNVTTSETDQKPAKVEANDTDENATANKPNIESPRIIPAEFTITKRANLLTPLIKSFFKFKNMGRLSLKAKSRGFLLIAVVVLLPLLAIVLFRSIGPSSEVKNAINTASENLRLAQFELNQNNTKEARALLQTALLSATNLSDKKIGEIKNEIHQTLGNINRVSDKQPQLYFPADPTTNNPEFKASLVAAFGDLVIVADPAGTVFSLNQSTSSELKQFSAEGGSASGGKIIPKLLFHSKTAVSFFNGSDTFGVYNLETKKTSVFSLKEPASAVDATLYEDNLYTLADNHIYKYADAATGGIKRTNWGSDDASGTLISITVDGNVYALNADGKLIKYFKGAKAGEVDLQLVPTASSRIFTFKDSAFVYLTDRTNGLVYVFDKATGELKTTYNLSLAGTINDIFISPDGSVWALSSDNKVWVIK